MERDSYFDTLKWVLIVLVVYGHMISHCYYVGGTFSLAMYNTIYSFHMPLFVFLSGRYSQMSDRKKYLSGILRLLQPYLLFQLLHMLYQMHQGGDFSVVQLLFWPIYIMWYLMSLILWRTIVYFAGGNFMARYPKAVIALSFVIAMVVGWIKIELPLSIRPTLSFLPFFILGYYSVKIDLKQRVRKVPLWAAVAVVLAVFACFYFLLNRNMRVVFASFVYRTPLDVALRAAYLFVAMVMSVAVMRIVPGGKRMAQWGRRTLFTYLWHPFVMFFILWLPVPKASDLWPVLYSAISVALLTWLSCYEFPNRLLTPITSWLKRK